jgi:hypothetical protein
MPSVRAADTKATPSILPELRDMAGGRRMVLKEDATLYSWNAALRRSR